jgi:hypothetical protein
MGYEILTQGKVIVKRPDREEILAIKNGAWSYENEDYETIVWLSDDLVCPSKEDALSEIKRLQDEYDQTLKY